MSEGYNLQTHLDSAAAPALAADLKALRGRPVRVDGGAVRFAGTLSLQVLIAARRQWLEDGRDFSVHPLSDALGAACSDLGLSLTDIGGSQDDQNDMERTA